MATAPVEVAEPETLTIPREDLWEQLSSGAETAGPYIVILYNCDCHTFEEVIWQMQKATGCSLAKGQQVAWEVHTRGRAIAYTGTQEDCERVANILREIRLQVETDRAL
ncbi:MAG TPA: ATP-dependent Clp protease adaptor ClpS [Capsulimonadaceae bacterium]|nr:ATP-dependent Clp protease adaptor ClpS [Capsulimonadaceae bacterium]